jgi:hypothetical protein
MPHTNVIASYSKTEIGKIHTYLHNCKANKNLDPIHILGVDASRLPQVVEEPKNNSETYRSILSVTCSRDKHNLFFRFLNAIQHKVKSRSQDSED